MIEFPDVPTQERLEIGLDIIHRFLPDGVTLTLREVAEICDVEHATIWQLEQKILKKLRKEYLK